MFASLFPEHVSELVGQRFDEVRKGGTVLGADEGFSRHAGDELQSSQPVHLLRRDGEPDEVVGKSGMLILRQIRRNADNLAVKLRRGPEIEGEKSDGCLLTGKELIDIRRRNSYLKNQSVVLWNNQHQRLGGRNNATNRMNGKFVNNPGLRCMDVDALQLVTGGDLALDEFAELCLYRSQFLGLSQIFLVNGMLTISGEIAAPNVAERSHDSECHCRKA